MTRIIVPFAERVDEDGRRHALAPELRETLGADAEFVDVGEDPHAYHLLLAKAWRECGQSGEDLVIVEQDMAPTRDALAALERCPYLWCTCPYPGPPIPEDLAAPPGTDGLIHEGLGCVRFKAQLIWAAPRLFELAPELTGHQVHWLGQDIGVARALRKMGFRAHEHAPVEHRAEYGKPASDAVEASDPDARRQLERFYEATKAWPDWHFTQLAVMLGGRVEGVSRLERGMLYGRMALAEDDLGAALEAIRTLRRAVAAVDRASQPPPAGMPRALRESLQPKVSPPIAILPDGKEEIPDISAILGPFRRD